MKKLVKTGTLVAAAAALALACSPKPKPEPAPPAPEATPTPTVVTLEPTPAPAPRPTPRPAEEDIRQMSLDRVSSYLKPAFFDYDKADLRRGRPRRPRGERDVAPEPSDGRVHDRGTLRRARDGPV